MVGTQQQRSTVGDMNGPWEFMMKVFLATFPVILTAHIGFGAWLVGQVSTNRTALAVIQGSRFTSNDGQKLTLAMADLAKELALLKNKVDVFQARNGPKLDKLASP